MGGGCTSKCQLIIFSYKDLHYDVLALGKQEVWMGYDVLKNMLDTTKTTQFVCANLVDVKTKRPLAKPTMIKDLGNMRVGFIGLLSEQDFPKGTTLIDSAKLALTPFLDAAKKYVPSLARKTDLVVLLTELPTASLDTLLKVVPQIDLVISNGALKSGEQLTTIGRTRVISPGSSGYSGHYLTVEFNPEWGDSIAVTHFTDFLADSYDEKGLWADRMNTFNTTGTLPGLPDAVKAAVPATAKSAAPAPAKPSTTTPDLSPTAPTNKQPVSAKPESHAQ